MQWLHQTWQCARCRFKLGCCEGACGEPYEPPSAALEQAQLEQAARGLERRVG
jgi:hypothetical protein